MTESKVKVTITLPEKLNQAIEKYAQVLGISKSEIIEHATQFMINLMKQEELRKVFIELLNFIVEKIRDVLSRTEGELFEFLETEENNERKIYGLKITIANGGDYVNVRFGTVTLAYSSEDRKIMYKFTSLIFDGDWYANLEHYRIHIIEPKHIKYIIKLMSKILQ